MNEYDVKGEREIGAGTDWAAPTGYTYRGQFQQSPGLVAEDKSLGSAGSEC